MPDPITAITAGSQLIGGYLSNKAATGAAESAGNAQINASQMGIDEMQKQFDSIQKLLAPYIQSGEGALSKMGDISGLGGYGAQEGAINSIKNSAMFKGLSEQGQSAILQNASATGGIRGGNTAAALSQFDPNLLNELITQEYNRLGGIASMGQSSATTQAGFGMQTGAGIAGLYGEQGAASAGIELAKGQGMINNMANLNKTLGTVMGAF